MDQRKAKRSPTCLELTKSIHCNDLRIITDDVDLLYCPINDHIGSLFIVTFTSYHIALIELDDSCAFLGHLFYKRTQCHLMSYIDISLLQTEFVGQNAR
jgi:hypothetical protein